MARLDLIEPPPDLVERFRADLGALLPPDASLLIAVSGGPDSLALLLLAHAALGERCFAATVDHRLRIASGEEAAGVARLCTERGIAHAILTGPLPDRANGTANLSTRARALRYRLLEVERVAVGAAAIATAHHADDQLETLVMRLNRGAGVTGLSGIRVRGGHIVRPLLGWRHADLVKLVADCGIPAVDDPSNRDERFDRARLRRQLVDADWLDPLGAVVSAAALADADAALEWTLRQLQARCCIFAASGVICEPVPDLPFELQRRLIRACIEHVRPAADLRGDSLVRAARSIAAGRSTVLAGVRCTVGHRAGAGPLWVFREAPPRRSR